MLNKSGESGIFDMTDKTDIEKFWTQMRSVYGRQKWDREFPLDDCSDIWSSALSRFQPKHILRAIGDCARTYTDWPPTLPQFLALCRAVSRPETELLSGPRVDPQKALEHVTEVRYLMELKRERPMSEEQRRIHWETLKL